MTDFESKTIHTLKQTAATHGRDFMAQVSVVFCGVARDCHRQLLRLAPQIERLGRLFKTYEVIVVENDSTDATGKLLIAWSQQNPRVSPIRFSHVERTTTGGLASKTAPTWFQTDRIERISYARNLYLTELQSRQFDYLIVMDMDLLDFSVEGIEHSFAKPDLWDAVGSYGVRYTLRRPLRRQIYWDTYAYEPPEGFPQAVQTLSAIRTAQAALSRRMAKGEWVQARSAFGGLCIYRGNKIGGARYGIVENADPKVPVLCEHVAFNRSIRKMHGNFLIKTNPYQYVHYEPLRTTVRRTLAMTNLLTPFAKAYRSMRNGVSD